MSSDSIAQETDALIQKLIALSKKDKRLVKSSIHHAPADPSIEVQSWKMNEFKYSTYPSPFPTLARGLFTRYLPGRRGTNSESAGPNDQASTEDEASLEAGGRHVIVARGYDKFFNIGEVPWNTWPALEKNTTPPYYLTLKSNGCIIFIAALAKDKLVVTSKHSLGQHSEGETSHAMQGQKWLYKHLKDKQRTPEELASRLIKDNITAVAELCDDSFEEHVLAYPPELSGLHLHGLNKNQGTFSTAPPSEVDAFAEEFGFIKTAFKTLNSIQEVREFTDHVAETGAWNGEAVEGFVVRTRIKERDSSETPARVDAGDKHSAPPYPPGSDFFFKVKFDEPYLMYRGWREITKAILVHKHNPSKPLGIPKSRLERPESCVYRDWVQKEINAHPEEFQDFAKGRGIVATRERFLEWLETSEGQKKLIAAGGAPKTGGAHTVVRSESVTPTTEKKFGKTVIVPIAVPGCGKTTLAVTLSRLFGFAHTQSDNIKAKKTAPMFQQNITELLLENNVVIADRNNHLTQHREGIREATRKYEENVLQKNGSESLPTRLIALHWNIRKLPLATAHRVCADRIVRRGDNHQSLRPSAVVQHEEIIWQFITHSEELTEGEVDNVIEMDICTESLEESVKRAIDGLLPLLPDLQRPNEGQIAEACDFALGFKVTIKKGDIPTKGKEKGPRYYGVLVEIDIPKIVGQAVLQPDAPAEAREFWEKLRKENRYTPRPHVTIVHANSLPAKQPLWDACAAVNKPPGLAEANSSSIHISPMFEFSIGSLLCDGDVMALTIENLRVRKDDESIVGRDGATALLDLMGEDVKYRLHATVGTKDQSVSPMLAGDMVIRWKKGQRVGIKEVPLGDQTGYGRVKGLS